MSAAHAPGTARAPATLERKDRARLIAAAPDLLAALKAMVKTCYDEEIDDATIAAVRSARAAISKAEGH